MQTMVRNFLLIAVLFSSFAGFSQKKEQKWDVNNPEGLRWSEVQFSVQEGTWMNIDASPDGKTLVFDLLGDIYTLPVEGGSATCIRSGIAWEVQPRFSPDGKQLLFTSDAGGGDNIWVMNADGSEAKQLTKEDFRLLNNPCWMPDGQYFIARKHFTSQRSLGAGEMWMYHLSGGSGLQLTKRKNDQQDVNEPTVSPDGRYVYFSEDMYPGGYFQYNKDPLKQITVVRRYDRLEGKVEEVTGGSGGAARPQISPDGRFLAFVRRVDTNTVLFVKNLADGSEFPVYEGLDKDQQEAWTVFGVYPGFAWLPAKDVDASPGVVIWAGGKIRKVLFDTRMLKTGLYGDAFERFKKGVQINEVPFRCEVKTKLAETVRFENKVHTDKFNARAIRQAVTSPDGKTLLFNAVGKLYRKSLPDGKPELLVRAPYREAIFGETKVKSPELLEYEPCFTPDGKSVVYVTWDDVHGGAMWTLDLSVGVPRQLPVGVGIFRTPQCAPDGKTLVYRVQGGDDELGPSRTAQTGIFMLNLNDGEPVFLTESGENPRFTPDGKRIQVTTGGYLFGALDKTLSSYDLNGKDKQVHFKSKYINQWVPSPDGKWLAFTELHKAYICAMPATGQTIDLSADTKAIPVSQVSRDAGYNLHWSADARRLHYTLGEELFTIDLNDRFAFLPGAPDSLPPLPETGVKVGLELETDKPEGTIVFRNARIITCEGDEVIENGVLAVTDNVITYVGPSRGFRPDSRPGKNTVIDLKGKTIMPGMVDVHAHSGNFRFGLSPQKQWEYYANLAYGVTTMHDPSVNSEMAFSNAEMIRSGRMTGPRLYSTGTILYGADGDFKAPINNLDDARSALRRTKAWGAFSVKSYNQPRRDQRQQVMAAAKELEMLVVPEGGSFFYHNMNQIVDGHTGVEHNIPVAPLYADVVEMWKRTQTHNTPTLIVCYGAVNGEYYWFQNEDIWKKDRLRRFTPQHILDERARHRTMIPDEEYQNGHILVSRSLNKLQQNGVNVNLGSHGQLQGLGAHWELWMLQQGGMSNLQALKCATINGARYLGMDKEIGSLKAGKLADLVILDENPLDNIRNTEKIHLVMVNGRLYDKNLDEIGNYNRKRRQFWFEMAGLGVNGDAWMLHSCQESKCVCGH